MLGSTSRPPDPLPTGLHLVGDSDINALEAAAREVNSRVRRIDLQGCNGKRDLLQRIATALAFPAEMGHNWDAVSDCMRDLGWLPERSYTLAFVHGGDLRTASRDAFDTLLDVLEQAATAWAGRAIPFRVFVAVPGNADDA